MLNRHQKRAERAVKSRRRLGVITRPRLLVFRSNQHMYAQVIEGSRVLAQASTLKPEIEKSSTIAAARQVGALVAERAKAAGVEAVVFDRAGYRYHGRVKAVAEGAREAGLVF